MQTVAEIISLIMSFLLSNTISEHRKADYCNDQSIPKYCYYKGESDRVIYYLHGFGNELESWGRNLVTKQIEQEWEKSNSKRPHIVTLTYDPFWLFFQKKNATPDLKKFIRQFEKKIIHMTPDSRILYGDSMGGHNALQWLKSSAHLFDRLALICPAISRSMTDEPEQEYVGLNWLSPLADKLFYHPEFNSADQIKEIVKIISKSKINSVYLGMTPRDEMGFYPGNQFLRDLFLKEKTNLTWEEQERRHCLMGTFTLANFLAS